MRVRPYKTELPLRGKLIQANVHKPIHRCGAAMHGKGVPAVFQGCACGFADRQFHDAVAATRHYNQMLIALAKTRWLMGEL